MKKLVVLSGAGVSQESGIQTFRGAGGLWEGYDVREVATPQAWEKNPELVLEFYNQRRKKLFEVEPNKAHKLIASLERKYDVEVITQNIDDLHERGGSKKVLHLHGELRKARSSVYEGDIYELDSWELKMGDLCKRGYQLRPHIVWFGEPVPAMEEAISIVRKADVFLIIGTSLNVYPAAGLVHYVSKEAPIYLIDPNDTEFLFDMDIHFIKNKATVGMEKLINILMK